MKKWLIFIFLVILPFVLGIFYDKKFEYAGNWLEDYQNYFKVGFLLVSITSSAWLALIAKKEKNIFLLVVSVIIFIILSYILYLGINLISISF